MVNLVELYKAVGDPHRLSILQMLSGQEMSVCEIMAQLKLTQPAVSHHLKILRQAALIKNSKQGKLVFYSLNSSGLTTFYEFISNHIEKLLSSAHEPNKPSALRENPNLCESLGFKRSICEDD